MQTGKTGLLAFYFSPLKTGLLEKTEDDSKGLLKIAHSIYFTSSLQIVKICKHFYIINLLWATLPHTIVLIVLVMNINCFCLWSIWPVLQMLYLCQYCIDSPT